jgi:rhamnose transport system permease protein
MSMVTADKRTVRHIPDKLSTPIGRLLGSWETLLAAVAIAIFIANSLASPHFLDPWNLSDATYNFTEKAMIAFAMTLLIISGEIDLSVAAIIALASTAMGAAAQAGFGTPALVGIGLGVGLLCGAFNGFLVARVGLPSIVVTIGTMSLFRGIAQIILGDRAYGGYPASFAWFGQGYMSDFSWWPTLPGFEVVTFEMVAFVVFALLFGILLHRTTFGRWIYAIGNNAYAAQFSGIPVQRTKFALFLMTGVMSGFAAVCLTSRLGSTRHTIAAGWELEVITMAVLGGVSILGGSGTIPGVVLAAIVMGLVTFGLGLLNVPGIVMSIFIGLLLILVIALPILFRRIRSRATA